MRFLLKRIESAEIVDPRRQTDKTPRLFRCDSNLSERGRVKRRRVRIVGIDEARSEFNEIS